MGKRAMCTRASAGGKLRELVARIRPPSWASWSADEFQHEAVDHAVEYVRGEVHTNGWENFWSLLKRGIHGTYVYVEPSHPSRYLDEQAFRYNHRKGLERWLGSTSPPGRLSVSFSRVIDRPPNASSNSRKENGAPRTR